MYRARSLKQVMGQLRDAEHVDEVEEQVEWRHLVRRDRPSAGLEDLKIIYHASVLRGHFWQIGPAEACRSNCRPVVSW